MSNEVSIDDLTQTIIQAYKTDIEDIHDSIMIAAKDCAAECLESIKEDSPSDTGGYKRGWVMRKTKQGYEIYNKTKPYLEMPLEYGHVIRRGPRKGQRVPAKPHIYKNSDKYQEQFYDKCVDIVAGGVRFTKE